MSWQRPRGHSALAELADRWIQEAATLRRRGAQHLADCLTTCIADLDEALQRCELELLSLEAAATESGYTYSALEKMIRSGRLRNAGRKGAPRVRRSDLPRKANVGGTNGPRLVERRLATDPSPLA
jgi:hypothetical protein